MSTTDGEKIQSLLDGFDIRVLFAQVDAIPTGFWNQPRLANSYWRLYQNDAPGGWLREADARFVLEPDRVYLIPSGLTLASGNDGPLNQFYIHFSPLGVSPVFFQMLFPKPVAAPHSEPYAALVAELGRRVRAGGAGDLGVQCSLKAAVLDAFGRCLSDPPADRVETYWRRLGAISPVLPAIRHIQEHLGGRITNARLAEGCHLSEDHFIRRFRLAVGLSPAQYVLRQRLSRAAQMLLFTDETIDQIAAETGFSDRFYFSRVFARENGLPPGQYRRGPRV